jgi:hypothetical protein
MGGKILKASIVLAVFAIAFAASVKAGAPRALPGAALDWRLLFHIERGAAILGAVGIVLLIGWRALSGEFPIKFGNVEYAAKEAAAEAKQATDLQEHRIRVLEVLAGVREPEDLEGGP